MRGRKKSPFINQKEDTLQVEAKATRKENEKKNNYKEKSYNYFFVN